ncbi:MAG: cytochrome c [Chloroflexi bacterium]|nr:cytochrome c [Chloroflexota bacterium]
MNTRVRKDRRKRQILIYLFWGVLIIGLTLWLTSQKNRPSEALVSDDILLLGKEVYAENCATCHGATGEGHAKIQSAPALNSSEHAWHHADGQLQRLITDGGKIMPSFGEKLTDDEIVAVIRYFQTWWTQSQLDSQQSLSEQDPFK